MLGPITLGIAVGIADSKRFVLTDLLSRMWSDAVFHVEATGFSFQVPHLLRASSPLWLASGAGRRFTGE